MRPVRPDFFLGRKPLDATSRPAVLISAGVGITPMIAMLNFIIAEGERTRTFRECYFIHGARNARGLPARFPRVCG